ncbi:transposase [Parasutterella secunda]|uniref:Transposase n=1 Tax=Parasutterella secunda TaxID=626947 RepID=A0ABS2GTL7_9BURK|nr:transposase [Parasutterella secunda]
MPMSHAGEQLYLRFRIRRVRCSCGCHQCEQLSWLEPKARLTNAMVGWIQALLRLRVPITDVVRHCSVSWDTVKTYDKVQLKALFNQIDLKNVEHLMIDEFAVHKGHRYATVIMDAVERKVVWIGMGKTKKVFSLSLIYCLPKTGPDRLSPSVVT